MLQENSTDTSDTCPSPDPATLSSDTPPTDIPQSVIPPSATLESDIPDSSQFIAPSGRKRVKKTLPQHISKTLETLESIKNHAIINRGSEDEFDHFGRNIASQLRQMPLIDALDLQSEILNLIKNKRQSVLRTEQGSCSSSESGFIIEIPEQFIIESQQTVQDVLQNQETTDASETNIQKNQILPSFLNQFLISEK